MKVSLHLADTDVQMEMELIADGSFLGVDEFSDSPIQLMFTANNKTFGKVVYMSREELEKVVARGQELLAEMDKAEVERWRL